MAVLKQKKEEKPKFVEKKFKIEQKVWKEAESYMKYAGFSGTPSEKLKDLFEAALEYVIGADKEGFEEFKRKVWKEAESYMKYAGFSGTPSEKLKDLFEAALEYVIGADKEGFEEFKRKEEEARANLVELLLRN